MRDDAVTETPKPAQLRAARALLGYSLLDAARRAGVSVASLHRLEVGEGGDGGSAAERAVGRMYGEAGIRFSTADGLSVSLVP